ncbi:probable isocitrate dehydrogenase [NAD] subunit beta, mitochondrial [Sycon ciliatum]|uniref:probable isocitrate dehydrogenase [NAD] subunit beta, mitochondrial n=1 Tax=Sycon ciliatum TaxID=27933 RepID=UPI0031F6DE3D
MAVRHLSRKAFGLRTVSLIPGDGVGPELSSAVKDVFQHMNVPVEFDEQNITGSNDSYEAAKTSLRTHRVGLKGIISTSASLAEPRSLNVQLRKDLGLFANLVRCRTMQGVKTRHKDVDMVIIRENTEGEYSGLEHESVPGVVESLKVVTAEGAHRIAKFAFETASRLNRRKVTTVHKANIMKLADGFFLQSCRDVAKDYPLIEFEDMIVDNCCMQLASRPQQFDVLVMGNLYGNIISNLGAGLVGGAGVIPGVNMGEDIVLFEPGARHRGHELAGKNTANPAGMLLTSASMLRHLRLDEYAEQIENVVNGLLMESQFHTPDLGGNSGTSDFVDALKTRL